MAIISLENIGPFKSRQSIDIKPLTLIIGKNSAGKSFLAYLIWALTITEPDLDTIRNLINEKIGTQCIKTLIDSIKRSKPTNAKDILEKILFVLVRDVLPRALARSLEKRLPEVYGKTLSSIITKKERRGIIEVIGADNLLLRIVINREGRIDVAIDCCDKLIDKVVSLIRIDNERGVLLVGDETWTKEKVATVADFYQELSRFANTVLQRFFAPVMLATKEATALLVDSRAGVLRVLLRPFTALLSETHFPDQAFIAYYYMLAERLAVNPAMPAEAEKLLEELGVRLEPRIEGGVYSIYVRTWTGETLPMPIAPSGARESATIVASLVNSGEPRLIIVEEPEAHLHPRAQVLLADLVAWAVRENEKWVIATTHSDYFVYEINNLIMAASRGRKGLDYRNVGAYLVRRGNGEAVIEPVPVDSEGIAEDEFARIAKELATARGFLALAENQ